MTIEIRFDMPYSLRIEGDFQLRTEGEEFEVNLSTHIEEEPRFPGAQRVENVAIVNDDTNVLSHTKVVAKYLPSDPSSVADPGRFSQEVSKIAQSIANALVNATRLAYGEYILDTIHHLKRLGPITFSVPQIGGRKGFFGVADPMMGGITMRTPSRSGPETSEFARILAEGAPITVAHGLYFDGRRYLVQGNTRMALANLVISFEVGLADSLSKVAASCGDSALEAQIINGTLGELGQSLAKRTLGHSLEESTYWTPRFSDAYGWLRNARNGILHKARTIVRLNNVTRDFANPTELGSLFTERDWLMGEIENAVARVIMGVSAKPWESDC
jgi:hypothetical protein